MARDKLVHTGVRKDERILSPLGPQDAHVGATAAVRVEALVHQVDLSAGLAVLE
jgi:hypothetical protein